jgi:hypothetical protein
MRIVTWTDTNNYQHRSIIRNSDPDDRAPDIGILVDPPDLNQLNFDQVLEYKPDFDIAEFKLGLHNRLVRLGLITWQDVQHSQSGLSNAVRATCRDRKILALLKRQLVALYRQ